MSTSHGCLRPIIRQIPVPVRTVAILLQPRRPCAGEVYLAPTKSRPVSASRSLPVQRGGRGFVRLRSPNIFCWFLTGIPVPIWEPEEQSPDASFRAGRRACPETRFRPMASEAPGTAAASVFGLRSPEPRLQFSAPPRTTSPFPLLRMVGLQRPGAVNGPPGYGAAERTLNGEDRCGA
jgi:hypothetical protein